MINLLDYVGTASRVGGRNIVWINVLFYFNVGDGTFDILSPQKISFTGTTYYLGKKEPLVIKVDILDEARCTITWDKETYRNVPYHIFDSQFVADVFSGATFTMERYNTVETNVVLSVNAGQDTFGTGYHIQPV